MATEQKWEAPAAVQTYLTTELNSLADGGNKLGGSIDNETDGTNEFFANLELLVATQGSARDSGATVDVYLLPSVDGTNYCYGADATDPPESAYVGSFVLDAATTARYVTLHNLPIPPLKFKLLVINNTGQALAATTNTLKYRLHSLESQ
jgi:hypothetical protein